jgi:hypothetical protein
MRHLRCLTVLAATLAITACAEAPMASGNDPAQPAFDETTPPADSTGRGVYAGGGQ